MKKQLTINKMSKKEINIIIDNFTKNLLHTVSKHTQNQYIKVAKALLTDTLNIKSKSTWFQAKSVIKKLVDYKLISKDNDFGIPKTWSKKGNTRLEKIQDRLITPEDFEKLLNHLPTTSKGQELRLACEIAFYSGLRLHEVLKLTDKNIKINGHIVIKIQGKGNKFRTAYLPKSMLGEMSNFKGFQEINYTYVRTTLKRAGQKIGVNTSFHGLRHSFATNMINSGLPITQLQSILGHSDIQTTAIYLHFSEDVSPQLEKLGY